MRAAPTSKALFPGLLSFLLLGLLAGCSDDSTPSQPSASCACGVIRGQVVGGDGAAAALVQARSALPGVGVGSPPFMYARAHTDSTGEYSMTVLQGEYLLSAQCAGREVYYSRHGPVTNPSAADTLEVRGDTLRADFPCGELAIVLELPSEAEASGFWARVETRGNNGSGGYAYSLLSQGKVEFRFPALPSGEYLLSLDLPSTPRFWLPGTADRGRATVFAVEAGRTASYQARLAPAGRITGRVTGSWQLMGTRAPHVSLRSSATHWVTQIDADDEGVFSLLSYVSGPMRLLVVIPPTERWIGGQSYEPATLFDLHDGLEISGVNVVESGISCRIEPLPSGWSLGAHLSLVRADGSVVVGANGLWENPIKIPNLDPGEYYLYLEPQTAEAGWSPQWYDGQDSLATATPIIVPAGGAVVPITMHLRHGGKHIDRMSEASGSRTVRK